MRYEPNEPRRKPAPRPGTEKAYKAWAVDGYMKGYGLGLADARKLAAIDWAIHEEVFEVEDPVPVRPAVTVSRQERYKAPITQPEQRRPVPKHAPVTQKVKDFRGVEFDSFEEMCRRWGRYAALVRYRLAHDWDLRRALTTPASSASPSIKEWRDHLGRSFMGMAAMAAAWGIDELVLKHRLAIGWTLERALTAPVRRRGRPCNEVED